MEKISGIDFKMMKAKKGVMAEEDNLSKYVREIKDERKPKGAKRLSDEVKRKTWVVKLKVMVQLEHQEWVYKMNN